MIPKSDDQREREARGAADREARQATAEEVKAERRQVRLYDGGPFAPASEIDMADASRFTPPEPEPPFKFTKEQRRAINDGNRPRLAFPKDKPCPMEVGDVFELSSQVAIAVTGISETKTEWELHYRIIDTRANLLGKAIDYSSSASGAIATRKAPEDQPLGGPQFRPEVEPEALSRREQEDISDAARDGRLSVLRESKAKMVEALDAMDADPAVGRFSSRLRHLRNELERLSAEVERQEAISKEAA